MTDRPRKLDPESASDRDPDSTLGFDPDSASSAEGIYGLPHSAEDAAVILIPVPWEATASYGTGTRNGPDAVREASHQVELLDHDTGRPYQSGIHMLPNSPEVIEWNLRARAAAEPLIEAGGDRPDEKLKEVDRLGSQLNDWVYETATRWRQEGKLVGLIGGDHSSPFGAIRAAAEAHPGLGIFHIDAHADLRRAYMGFQWSHGSIFYNVRHEIGDVTRLVQFGIRDVSNGEREMIHDSAGSIRTYFDSDVRRRMQSGEAWEPIAREAIEGLPDDVYISFDIDGLDPSLCPHTGTPVPGGITFQEAVSLLRLIVETGRRIVGFDLCEVAPDPTGATEWDGNVGARILYKLIGFALMSRD